MLELYEAKSILTQTGGYLSSFTHSLNAYQGCAFGRNSCPYCYVRAMPIQRFAGAPWGEWVKAKVNAPELLRRELERADKAGLYGRLRIFMSTATDPYQGAEARLQLTRGILRVFGESGGFGLVVVQTRSPLVLRDLDLLSALGDRVAVSLTIETNRDEVRRKITPTSPSIERRLECLEKLGRAGIRTQAAISPVLPCDPIDFAELIASRTERAIVDTLVHGDGACGRRSAGLGMEKILLDHGFSDWMTPESHLPLLEALRNRMGASSVGFSQDGFNRL